MFYYYKHLNNVVFSLESHRGFSNINEEIAQNHEGKIFFLGKLPLLKSRMSFLITDPSMFYLTEETVDLLRLPKKDTPIMSWIKNKIEKREVVFVNEEYPKWENVLNHAISNKWKVNIVSIGDIGRTLLIGLKLLGGESIESIGIFDKNDSNLSRWELEMNQIFPPFEYDSLPQVNIIKEKDLTDCDMLVFCATPGYSLESPKEDMNVEQLSGNAQMINFYAQLLRNSNFKGIFAIMSSPTNLLCKKVFMESNRHPNGTIDYKGLAPEQIRGYGLAAFNNSALYFAKKNPKLNQYLSEGRAFGSQGKGLIIANSIANYDYLLSDRLTDLALTANMKVKELGYKPFIAQALSSGAQSIIATINGSYHYSSTFLGGAFMGSANRFVNQHIELERLDLPDELVAKIKQAFDDLMLL